MVYMSMFDDIECSYPAADDAMIGAAEQALSARLPSDYKAFLRTHNGGFAREFRYTFLTGVPFKQGEIYNPSREDCVVELFGIPAATSSGRQPMGLVETAAVHRAERFLPTSIIAVASCVQSSLVCMSLRQCDHGAIYYWEYYWRYPWCKEFFDERIEDARARMKDDRGDIKGAADVELASFDALNFATLVRIAPSFSEWSQSCFDGTDAT